MKSFLLSAALTSMYLAAPKRKPTIPTLAQPQGAGQEHPLFFCGIDGFLNPLDYSYPHR